MFFVGDNESAGPEGSPRQGQPADTGHTGQIGTPGVNGTMEDTGALGEPGITSLKSLTNMCTD